MVLLFENFAYNTKELTDALGFSLNQLQKCFNDLPHDFSDKNCYFEFVGYYYCHEIGDSVFVMPKVFISGKNAFCHTLREGGFDPNKLINITLGEEDEKEKDKIALDDNEKRMMFNVSLWLYQSIKRYCEQFGEGNILNGDIQRVVTTQGLSSETMLDSVISLNNFYRSHRSLFTFISINKSANNTRINWRKTISTKTPVIQDGTPIYMSTISKAKSINYDDDVIVLFLSVMNYLSDKYYFGRINHDGYDILPPHKVETLLEDGIGVRKMRQIRHKYFTDELVQLCDILTVFFEQASEINSNRQTSEMTIVKVYDKVFEAMIDNLIGDKMPEGLNYLKHQEGGSRHIDHLFGYDSLIKPNKEQIYYIGDSKYYKETTELGDYSVEKQYSYARNVVQYCIDIFEKKQDKKIITHEENNVADNFFYRDEITEGYNITPNFFVEGIIRPEEMLGENDTFNDKFLKENNDKNERFKTEQHQFKNRLFDRDTLLLRTFDINFLYVLNSYVSRENNSIARQKIKEAFKKSICEYIDNKYFIYNFPGINTKKQVEDFINLHFKTVIGKVISYKTKNDDDSRQLFIALETTQKKSEIGEEKGERSIIKVENISVADDEKTIEIVEGINNNKHTYTIQKFKVSNDTPDVLNIIPRSYENEEETIITSTPDNYVSLAAEDYIQIYSRDYPSLKDVDESFFPIVLAYTKSLDWVESTGIYNFRSGENVPGSVDSYIKKIQEAKTLVLYKARLQYVAFKSTYLHRADKEEMLRLNYKNPKDYYHLCLVRKIEEDIKLDFEKLKSEISDQDAKDFWNYKTVIINRGSSHKDNETEKAPKEYPK